MSNRPGVEGTRIVLRRRRTRRHRRNRHFRRALLVTTCALFTFVFSAVALRYLTPSLFRASRAVSPSAQSIEAARAILLATQQESAPDVQNRPVYPYSVVPGGVRTVRELKWAAEHDPVVAAHYAGFNYDRARVVRLVLARTAYISYRIGNKVYWTRHRVSLKKGETVLTDGNMTARTRCGNRVEVVPQQPASPAEPPAAKFDEPVPGPAMTTPPVPFQSSLLNRPPAPGLGPAVPLGLYDPFQSGNGVPSLLPPPPEVCGVGVKKKPGSVGGAGGSIAASGKGKKKVINPCGSGGLAEVPEPGTWLLMLSGLALIVWKMREPFARA